MLATQPKSSIPSDAANQNNLLQPFRATMLDEFARSRRTVHHLLRNSASTDPSVAIRVTDQLLGVALLMRFVRQHQAESIPNPESLFNTACRQTVRGIVADLRNQMVSPVLRAVFDPADWDDSMRLPHGLYRHLFDTRIPHTRLVLTAFGDLHQLNLADPLINASISRRSGGVRRLRGIHYTPPGIVDYLTHRVFAGMEIPNDPGLTFRILDPSCGCGAFLIASANRLFKANEHQNFSLQKRLDLLSFIRGIDIDSQAIIWARRVLLLTAWQDAIEMNAHGADNSVNIPDLSKTIVAADFLFTPLEPVDALIGGPPFVRLQQLRLGDPEKFARYQDEFQTARSGQFDLYMLFFEKAINMLAEGGRLGWSVSNTFLRSQSGRAVRQQISSKCDVRELVEFEARKIYPDAVTQIALVLLERTERRTLGRHVWIRGSHGPLAKLQLLLDSDHPSDTSIQISEIPAAACSGPAWSLHSHQESDAGQTITGLGKPLGELPIQICSGIVTGADEVFLVRSLRIRTDGITVIRNRAGSEHLIETALLRPIIRNRDVHAFKQPMPNTLCIVPYDERGKLMDEIVFQDRFPRTYRYLKLHHRQLADRPVSSELPWYSFRSSAALQLPPGPRILLKRISSRPDYALDPDGSQLCHGTVIILALTSLSIDPLAILGIFNSSIFWNFVRSAMPTIADGHAIQIKNLRDFPLPCLPNTTAECDIDAIRASVRKLLDNTIKSSGCAMTRKELDAAVNRLYRAGEDNSSKYR